MSLSSYSSSARITVPIPAMPAPSAPDAGWAPDAGCADPPAHAKSLPLLLRELPFPPDREALLLAHVPQVRLIARSFQTRTGFAVEIDDLVGYGMLGLLDAVGKFDPSRGIQLKTYAEFRIRGAILDGLRGLDWLSRSARKLAKTKIRAQAGSLALAGSPGPLPAAVNDAANDSLGGLSGDNAAEKRDSSPLSPYPVRVFYVGGIVEMEQFSRRSRHQGQMPWQTQSPERALACKQERSALASAMEDLPERQRNVLKLYYHREWSMKQIALLLGVHESRVSQLHLAAISGLRKLLNAAPRPVAAGVARRVPPKACVSISG